MLFKPHSIDKLHSPTAAASERALRAEVMFYLCCMTPRVLNTGSLGLYSPGQCPPGQCPPGQKAEDHFLLSFQQSLTMTEHLKSYQQKEAVCATWLWLNLDFFVLAFIYIRGGMKSWKTQNCPVSHGSSTWQDEEEQKWIRELSGEDLDKNSCYQGTQNLIISNYCIWSG